MHIWKGFCKLGSLGVGPKPGLSSRHPILSYSPLAIQGVQRFIFLKNCTVMSLMRPKFGIPIWNNLVIPRKPVWWLSGHFYCRFGSVIKFPRHGSSCIVNYATSCLGMWAFGGNALYPIFASLFRTVMVLFKQSWKAWIAVSNPKIVYISWFQLSGPYIFR